ncbi:tetratricopeptide repeat protein [Roseibium sp. RKSG952]|uniref:tetratricopeptide repeat protein n=1 Tax=Roseibium sp. RKSG952 TaxID=2529384 RepID=UPI0012BBEDEA|nr:tetratricopeptide repeat protein [Roseibium sp. RKSG952]MTI00383.1 tetratricopeptide repeat protein [Roseibium sp. RKSG952]
MSDIFREVDEDIRKEKYRRLWDRFGVWVIAVAVLIVVGTGGYRGWLYWESQKAAEAGDTFVEANRLADGGNYQEAKALFDALGKSTGGYPVLARLREATMLSQEGRSEEALVAFDEISRDGSVEKTLQDIAALRAGYLAVDLEDYNAVADRVEGLSADGEPFRAAAREILAVSAWKGGDINAARSWISKIEDDAGTPTDVTRRIGILNDVIQSEHGSAETSGEEASQ